jgi:hypothetical protein
MKSQVFWNVIPCLTIILHVQQGQQEAITYQHNVTYQMPESSTTLLPKLQVSKVQETFLVVHGRSAKCSILPYTSPCKSLKIEITARYKSRTVRHDTTGQCLDCTESNQQQMNTGTSMYLLRNQGPEHMPQRHRSLSAYCATLVMPCQILLTC